MPGNYLTLFEQLGLAARFWCVVMRIRPEVAQANEWLGTGVFNFNAGGRSDMRDKDFVGCIRAETNHGWRLQIE